MKTIVITGASRGIGLAAAKKFLDEDWRVIGTYNKTPISLKDPNFLVVELDQSSAASIEKAAAKIKEEAKHIDVLVNNAGVTLDFKDDGADVDKIRKTFEVNVFGLVGFTEKLLENMSAGSHIINVDSLYGSFSFDIDDTTSTGYRMSKAALNMYTRTLAFRLKEKKIIVSSLDPGWVKTDMGTLVATETEGPDRQPEDAAQDIYVLATEVKDSGNFWRFGKKREW